MLGWGVSSLRERLLARLKSLRPGTTVCPGKLARDCGTTLRAARADLLALAQAGKITLSQRGRDLGPAHAVKGPFRVRLRTGKKISGESV
jgi:hypothetical protein